MEMDREWNCWINNSSSRHINKLEAYNNIHSTYYILFNLYIVDMLGVSERKAYPNTSCNIDVYPFQEQVEGVVKMVHR